MITQERLGNHASFGKGGFQMHMILLCRSMTSAQKAARALQRAGIFASVVKAPQQANPGGCTYGVKIAERNLIPATEALKAENIPVLRTLEEPERSGSGVRL